MRFTNEHIKPEDNYSSNKIRYILTDMNLTITIILETKKRLHNIKPLLNPCRF